MPVVNKKQRMAKSPLPLHDISSDDLNSLIVQVPPHTKLRVSNNNLSAADLETLMPNKWINDQVTLVNNYACT